MPGDARERPRLTHPGVSTTKDTMDAVAFFTRRSGLGGTTTQAVLGWLMILLGLPMLLLSQGGGASVGLGILVLVLNNWAAKNPIVRLHQDHVEIRPGMVAPTSRIAFSEIREIVEKPKGRWFLFTHQNKKVFMPLGSLEVEARDRVLARLHNQIDGRYLGLTSEEQRPGSVS